MTRNAKFEDEYAFQCRACKLPQHVRQFAFANTLEVENLRRRYRADFCFPEYWLLVEINGGVWRKGGGAHSHPLDIERNMRKQNDATLWRWSVLNFTTDQVTNGEAIGFTQKTLFSKGWRQGELRAG